MSTVVGEGPYISGEFGFFLMSDVVLDGIRLISSSHARPLDDANNRSPEIKIPMHPCRHKLIYSPILVGVSIKCGQSLPMPIMRCICQMNDIDLLRM
jgi:hypothetical protein